MNRHDPRFDAIDGQVLFRSCAEGLLHSVVLGESALDAGTAAALADAILRAAAASHLKAAMQTREEMGP